MGAQNRQQLLAALKSLSSLLISLFSIIGIVFTLLIYFIVSPSIASIDDSSSSLFASLVKLSDVVSYDSKMIEKVSQSQSDFLDKMERALNNTRNGIRASRESLNRLEEVGGYDLSNQTIRLKASEDGISELLIEVKSSRESINADKTGAKMLSENMSTEILRAANEFTLSISSLNTLFTGMTIVLIIVFLSIILLSAEDLLT